MPSCQGVGRFVIRTSDRGIFRSCRLRWDFTSKIRQNYEPKSSQPTFDFGTSIHAGLEAYYEAQLLGSDRTSYEAVGLACFGSSEELFRQEAAKFTPDGFLSDEQRQQFDDRKELGLGMLRHYFTWAPQADTRLTVKMIEVEFEVPIPATSREIAIYDRTLGVVFDSVDGELYCSCDTCDEEFHPVVYQGRIDLLAEDQHGLLWIIDHKTAAQFGSTDFLDVDDQCGSYCWALRRRLQLPVHGVIYNRLLKSAPHPPAVLKDGSLSKNKQQRTTYDLYRQAIEEHNQPFAPYAEFLEYLKHKPNQFFQRIPVYRGPEEDRTIERRILIEAIEILGDPWIYPNPGMFNCMGCAFKPPCLATQDGSDVKWIMESMYQKRSNHDQPVGVDGVRGSDGFPSAGSDLQADSGIAGRPQGPSRL